MLQRFRRIDRMLYRGGHPSVEDVVYLNKKFGIKRIISLDILAGKHIERVCKILEIEHIIIPIDVSDKMSIINLFEHNLDYLFGSGVPTYIHCMQGKDRTGLVAAVYRCKYQGWDCNRAIAEAKKLGFGIGIDPTTIKFYEKIISKFCMKNHDHLHQIEDANNASDIVSGERDSEDQYRDFNLDSLNPQSWSPYTDYRVRMYPYGDADRHYDEQFEGRNDYKLKEKNQVSINENTIPMVGQYDSNTQGISGAGPSMIGSGIMP